MSSDVIKQLKVRSGEEIELIPGLHVPSGATINVTDWRGFNLRIEVELRQGRYQCTELHISQRPGGDQVTSEALREVPVAAIIRDAIVRSADMPCFPRPVKELDGRTPTRETLEAVAAVYQVAYAVNDFPKQRVAGSFGIATSTAGRWIARAREAGLLPPADPLVG